MRIRLFGGLYINTLDSVAKCSDYVVRRRAELCEATLRIRKGLSNSGTYDILQPQQILHAVESRLPLREPLCIAQGAASEGVAAVGAAAGHTHLLPILEIAGKNDTII